MIVSYAAIHGYGGLAFFYAPLLAGAFRSGASDCEWIVPGTIDHEGNSLCDPRYSGL